MEEMLCAMALNRSQGRQTHHILAGLFVCSEQALQSVGERTTHGGYGRNTTGGWLADDPRVVPLRPRACGGSGAGFGVQERGIKYGWIGHKSGSGFSDLAPSILYYNWF
jgi:hypothetical protein